MTGTSPASAFPRLSSPLTVGQHRLRNRVIMGSMHTRLETGPDPVRRQAAFYGERARGGVALIVTGGVSPNREGRIEEDGPTLERRGQLPEHRGIVEAVHAFGAKIIMQILHTGAYAKHDAIVGVSAVRSPINPRTPRVLTGAEIDATIDDFARCAELAVEAGYDGVEIMGSEGYFLTQCLTARVNTRTDAWGGSLENRMRVPLEVVRRLRRRIGRDPLVSYRISALDLVERGQTGSDIIAFAQALEEAGVDVLNTGIGWHEAMVPTIAYMVPRAAFTFATRRLKDAVGIPVMAANRINMPDVAEAILAANDADLVSLARPLLADPDFVNKAAAGRADEINTCIACNQACLDYIFTGREATCLVNPRAARETEIMPAAVRIPRRIAVVGGGPAGLAFSVTAAARGHHVCLFEAESTVGGQLLLARAVPGKSEFDELLRYFRRQLDRWGVEVRTQTRASAGMLADGAFDRIVLASGITARHPDIPGIDHPSVVSYADVLSGKTSVGRRVAIIGTGGIGHDVALFLAGDVRQARDRDVFLAAWGVDPEIAEPGGLKRACVPERRREVVMLQRSSGRVGERLGKTTGWIHRAELRRLGVAALTDCRYLGIDDSGLHVSVRGEVRVLGVDTIVVCAGQEPNRDLESDLASAGARVDLIGGARLAGELDAVRAIEEGVRLACAL